MSYYLPCAGRRKPHITNIRPPRLQEVFDRVFGVRGTEAGKTASPAPSARRGEGNRRAFRSRLNSGPKAGLQQGTLAPVLPAEVGQVDARADPAVPLDAEAGRLQRGANPAAHRDAL